MMKSDKQNRSFFWATVFLRELYCCGVEHLVISPGSRSTPLVMAATSHPGFSTHVILDERSAAYFALGIGKATGTPAGLICTSGTAAANYYPAAIEARQSGIPMIMLTADRPPNLRGIGASQAIDQIKMFGDYPVFFHEAGEPIIEHADLERIKQVAGQAFEMVQKRQGPAHINFPFRKPLEPDPHFVEKIETENRKIVSDRHPKTALSRLKSPFSPAEEIQTLLQQSSRPVVIAGPQTNTRQNSAIELSDKLNAPCLAEFPASVSNQVITGFNGFLRNDRIRSGLNPDLIVRFGQQPVSKSLQFYLEDHPNVPHIHFADLEEWHDFTHTVTHRVEWFGRNIDWDFKINDTFSDWINRWKEIERHFTDLRKKEIGKISQLTDGHVFFHLSQHIPDSWNLFLSNSLPIRDWMLFAQSIPGRTFVNRGASGIDGMISTAVGATVGSNKPGILFIGDLATLHDCTALLSSRLLEQPLVVILLNNSGGNIFRILPVYRHREVYTDYFETPQNANFHSLAETFSINCQTVTTTEQLDDIDPAELASSPGVHLVECRTESKASMKLRKKLWSFSI